MSTLPDRDSPAWRERYNSLPGGVSLGSAPSEELLEELERLRAMEHRAREVAGRRVAVDETSHPAAGRIGVERVTARYILGEA